MGDFLRPDSILMLFLAVMLDFIGFLCLALEALVATLGIGIGLSFVPDVLGILLIGGWLYFVKNDSVGLQKGSGKKLLGFGGGELVPGLGDIAPFWTILVITEILSD